MDVDVVRTLEWKPFCNNIYQKGKNAEREALADLRHRRRPDHRPTDVRAQGKCAD